MQFPKEIISFNEKIEEFRDIGCEVVTCSVDSHYSHLAWVRSGKERNTFGEMKVVLLSDANHEISKAYGVYRPEWGYTLR